MVPIYVENWGDNLQFSLFFNFGAGLQLENISWWGKNILRGRETYVFFFGGGRRARIY